MKKLLFLFMAIALSVAVANAQENVQNGKVVLKSGSTVEWTIQTQGTNVIVTTSSGDVFYYNQDEISKIQTGETDNKLKQAGHSLTFKEYKRMAKETYKEARVFGNDMSNFWGNNDISKIHYTKYRKLNTAAWITAATGGVLVVLAGPILSEWESTFSAAVASEAIGGVCLITACILPIVAHVNLKRSWQYYDRYGKDHAVNVSAMPVVYARGGAGIGIAINF